MSEPKFSVVVIAKNEAETLPRLFKSLDEFRDRGGEVVVVDTRSRDGTVAVAQEWGAKVHAVGDSFASTLGVKVADAINCKFVCGDKPIALAGETLFHFSDARNYASSLAKNNVVAMPDADEAYTKLDIDAINAAIDRGVEQLEYPFVYAHDDAGKPWMQFTHCKFYDRRKLKWTGIIHEVLEGEAKREVISGDVITLEHWQNAKTDRSGYLRGLAFDCILNPENDRNAHYLGRELMYSGRYKSAVEQFKRHIALNGWAPEKAQSYVYMGDCLKVLYGDDFLDSYWHAIAIDSTRREPWMRLAWYYYSIGDHQRTACYAQAALAIPYSPAYMNNMAHYRHEPHELLYWALWYLGDIEGAKMHFALAKSYRPDYEKYKHDAQFFQ